MSIEIQTNLQPEYAYVGCRGTFESDAMLEVWEKAFQFAAAEGRKAVLVDMRDLTGGPPTTIDRYDQGARVADLQRGCGAGIAIACLGHEPMIDPDRLGEIVARNRGAFGRAFTDFDEAVDWIEAELRQREHTNESLRK
jgi:hypothetical protein